MFRFVVAAPLELHQAKLDEVQAACLTFGADMAAADWFESGRIHTWHRVTGINHSQVEQLRGQYPDLDFGLIDLSLPEPKLLLSDMDATMIVGESIDEMADVLGLHEKISRITARAMAGELDFGEALEERVGLLKGLPIAEVENIGRNIQLQAGAKELIDALKRAGVRCVLVSGGFTIIAELVAKQLGFDQFKANILEVDSGKLSGLVEKPYVGKAAKLELLKERCQQMGIDLKQSVTLGDGANDIAMLQAAGVGCGFEGKEQVRQATPFQINVTDLRTLLAYLNIKA